MRIIAVAMCGGLGVSFGGKAQGVEGAEISGASSAQRVQTQKLTDREVQGIERVPEFGVVWNTSLVQAKRQET